MLDHPVPQGWRERVAGKDVEMARALELIAAARARGASLDPVTPGRAR
jgi:hypothetical protein